MGINGAKNAGLLAVQMLAQQDTNLTEKLQQDRAEQARAILADD